MRSSSLLGSCGRHTCMIIEHRGSFVVHAPYNQSLQADDHVGRFAPSLARR